MSILTKDVTQEAGAVMAKLRRRVVAKTVPQAFMDELMEKRVRLRVYALSLTRDRDDADDLVHDTLIKALEGYASFQPGTNLSAWVFRIMRNEFISGLRRHRSQVPIDSAVAEMLSHQPHAEGRIHVEEMLHYLACLERNQCDSLIAALYLGMDYEKIADLFGVSIGTVKSRISRGRDELEAMMENGVIKNVDIAWFKNATRGLSEKDWYYPIAKAYEELFADVHSSEKNDSTYGDKKTTKEDEAWSTLVASGALDSTEEDVPSLLA